MPKGRGKAGEFVASDRRDAAERGESGDWPREDMDRAQGMPEIKRARDEDGTRRAMPATIVCRLRAQIPLDPLHRRCLCPMRNDTDELPMS